MPTCLSIDKYRAVPIQRPVASDLLGLLEATLKKRIWRVSEPLQGSPPNDDIFHPWRTSFPCAAGTRSSTVQALCRDLGAYMLTWTPDTDRGGYSGSSSTSQGGIEQLTGEPGRQRQRHCASVRRDGHEHSPENNYEPANTRTPARGGGRHPRTSGPTVFLPGAGSLHVSGEPRTVDGSRFNLQQLFEEEEQDEVMVDAPPVQTTDSDSDDDLLSGSNATPESTEESSPYSKDPP